MPPIYNATLHATTSRRVREPQAWRPGQIGAGSSPKSSQPAPETMQLVPAAAVVAKPSSGNGSARSGSSSARGRLPSMQLVRVNSNTSVRPTGSDVDVNGHTNGTTSGGGDNSVGGGNGVHGGGGGDASWMMAVAAPMPVLHGFCLAVIGLTTGVVGENVTLVDRSAGATDEEAAVGFLGFDQVRIIASAFHSGGDTLLTIAVVFDISGLASMQSWTKRRFLALNVIHHSSQY